MKKKVCFSIPCYNELHNVVPIAEKIIELFSTDKLKDYVYSIEFIDNKSTDGTREKLRYLCNKYPDNIKAIFNVRNFGGVSNFYGLLQTKGDCTIILPCDFQVPLEIIPELLNQWELGAKVVCAIKANSKENRIMWNMRNLYYWLIKKFSSSQQIDHFTGAGLYDHSFIEWLNLLQDPLPSLRGMVAEYGYNIKKVYYVENKRKNGKSKNTFISLFDIAIHNIISYTHLLPYLATFLGLLLLVISIIFGFVYLILKLIYWNNFSCSIAPILFGIFFIGGIQLAFLGLFGEYLRVINQRLLKRSLVIEEERINFDTNMEEDYEVCTNKYRDNRFCK